MFVFKIVSSCVPALTNLPEFTSITVNASVCWINKYPPDGMDDAVQTVMLQCELWTDSNDMMLEQRVNNYAERLGQYVKEIH